MTAALSITNLSKTYSNGLVALNGINLEVRQGDFFALLGRNGAGKSTAIGIISSLVNKTAGSVRVFGTDIDRDFALAKSCIGIVPQEMNFSVFETPLQIVCNQAGYYGIPRKLALERAATYLKQLDLWEKRDEISRNLSGGMKRRLMIARSLMHEPRLLILDEPTAGVDIEIRRSMWGFLTDINRRGTTIILTTHYLEEAEALCRTVAIIEKGEVLASSSTRDLLGRLQRQTYVLELQAPLEALPNDVPEGWLLTDPATLEIEVRRSDDINTQFEILDRLAIRVKSIRSKTNRLEKLFLQLVEGEGDDDER